MYSLKKTMLNILIGIAAVGVATATADDTSASSVSLSLSLTNVVPSNKAGKQTKAGKQVKAVVGKAVKAKAIKFKYDNSLSNSMSMSYGPGVDPDTSPDYSPGLQAPRPDGKSARAGLIFGVSVFQAAIETSYPYTVEDLFAVFVAGTTQFLSQFILDVAGARAVRRGADQRIELSDIQLAVKNDEELNKLLGGVSFDSGAIPDFVAEQAIYKVFKEQNHVSRISENSMSHLSVLIFNATFQGIVGKAIEQAASRGTYNLNAELAELGFKRWVDSVSVSPDGPLITALAYGQTAAALYVSNS